MNDKLEGLWAEYRAAVGDPDAGPDFMPGMWRKIEARRAAEATVSMFRRFTQIYVVATVALTLLVGAMLLPTSSNNAPNGEAFFSGTYVEILAADRASDLSQVMPVGDFQ